MAHRRVRVGRWVALLGVVALGGAIVAPVAGAAGGGSGDFPAVDQPGVTDTQITVSGVATVTNDPTGNTLGSAFDGVKAYFEYVNTTEGGVYGRELVLEGEHDDQLANNRQEIERILSDDQPFAVLPVATDLFTGAALLAENGIPTFGWNINPEWGSETNESPPNLFGQYGSFHCFSCAFPSPQVWLAKKLGLKKAATLAFEVEQSAACADGFEASLEKFPVAELVFKDTSLPFGNADYSADVARMVEEGVDYVVPCIDGNGAVLLLREMQRQGLDATMLMANAYNQEFAEENAQFVDGNYVFTVFAPFETRPKPAGLKLYQKWMKRAGDHDQNENSYTGWMNADLFVTGLKAAGPDFTQQKVVDAVNGLTDFTAGGILPGVDWTKAHENDAECYVISQFVDGGYEPKFGKPGKPFVCFPADLQRIPKNPQVR